MAWADWNESIKLVDNGGSVVEKERKEYVLQTYDDLANIPTDNLLIGSIAWIISTKKYYMWDSLTWVEQGNGSGGGGGGVEDFNITLTFNSDTELYDFDKTWKEVKDAFDAGKRCLVTESYHDENEYGAETRLVVGTVCGYNYDVFTGDYPSATYKICVAYQSYIAEAYTDTENGYPNM